MYKADPEKACLNHPCTQPNAHSFFLWFAFFCFFNLYSTYKTMKKWLWASMMSSCIHPVCCKKENCMWNKYTAWNDTVHNTFLFLTRFFSLNRLKPEGHHPHTI